MYYQFLLVNNKIFLLLNNTLLDMTINNPIFIFAVITVIWFIPGIIVRRFNEVKQTEKKNKRQAEAINKLYPKQKDWKCYFSKNILDYPDFALIIK